MSTETVSTARFHPMVLAAQARLARQGGWSRALAGEALDERDEQDAALLVAAGVLVRTPEGYTFGDTEMVLGDAAALASGNIAVLRHALRYAEQGEIGWSGEDLEIVRAQGRASAAAADMMVEQLVDMAGSREALRSGRGRFLDVGVGVGAVSTRLCQLFPGTTAVGLDVLPGVLEVAHEELEHCGLADRVELRRLDVADLRDERAFDLAWLPQPFVARSSLERGLRRVHTSLRPDRWLVMVVGSPEGDDRFARALTEHAAHVLGGGPLTREQSEELVTAAGFEHLAWRHYHGLALLLARRP